MTHRYLVQFSTGLGSAEAARRIHERGDGQVVLITADTRCEDPDNWRFGHEVVDRLLPGCEWHILADGRRPMQVGLDEGLVPNNRMAVCSRILKRELIRRWIDQHGDPGSDVVVLGFDWTEPQRHASSVEHWQPFPIESPLAAPPYTDKAALIDHYRDELGIEPPRLYSAGFSHANCGGACVRGGQAAWRRLYYFNPERYAEWEAEEQEIRRATGKDISILRDRTGGTVTPVSLKAFRRGLEASPSLFDAEDEGACGCDPWVDST